MREVFEQCTTARDESRFYFFFITAAADRSALFHCLYRVATQEGLFLSKKKSKPLSIVDSGLTFPPSLPVSVDEVVFPSFSFPGPLRCEGTRELPFLLKVVPYATSSR